MHYLFNHRKIPWHHCAALSRAARHDFLGGSIGFMKALDRKTWRQIYDIEVDGKKPFQPSNRPLSKLGSMWNWHQSPSGLNMFVDYFFRGLAGQWNVSPLLYPRLSSEGAGHSCKLQVVQGWRVWEHWHILSRLHHIEVIAYQDKGYQDITTSQYGILLNAHWFCQCIGVDNEGLLWYNQSKFNI